MSSRIRGTDISATGRAVVEIAEPGKLVTGAFGVVIGTRPVARYSSATEHYLLAAVLCSVAAGRPFPSGIKCECVATCFNMADWCRREIGVGGSALLWAHDLPLTMRFLGMMEQIGTGELVISNIYMGDKQRFAVLTVDERRVLLVDMLNFTDVAPDKILLDDKWPIRQYMIQAGLPAGDLHERAVKRSVVTFATLMKVQQTMDDN